MSSARSSTKPSCTSRSRRAHAALAAGPVAAACGALLHASPPAPAELSRSGAGGWPGAPGSGAACSPSSTAPAD